MQGRAPCPAGPRPRSSTSAGSTGLTPLYIQCEGQGLPVCGRSRNQSTCVPLPCHRESGQKARSQVRGMPKGQGAPPPWAEAGAQCCPCLGKILMRQLQPHPHSLREAARAPQG